MTQSHKKTPPLADDTYQTLSQNLGHKAIILVGLMGAGKSTIGKLIATLTQLPFVDTDFEIEQISKMRVAEIFAAYGEAEFRRLEQRVIERLLKQGPIIIATGGGAFMNDETRLSIRQSGISVWLDGDIETLFKRVSRRQTRPLLKNDNPRATLERLAMERNPIYAEADIRVKSENIKRHIIAHEVVKGVNAFLSQQPK